MGTTYYSDAKGWYKADYQIDRDTLALEYGSVNKCFLLKRGWTRTSIKRILGEPDRRLPMRRRPDRPEARYDMARVLAAEAAGKIRYRRARAGSRVTWAEFLETGCAPPTGKGIPGRKE